MQLSIACSSVSYISFHLITSSGSGRSREQRADRFVIDRVAFFLELLDQRDVLRARAAGLRMSRTACLDLVRPRASARRRAAAPAAAPR